MKGSGIPFALLVAAIAFAIVVSVEVYMLGTVGNANWEKTVKFDLTPSPITSGSLGSLECFPTGSLTWAKRNITKDNEPFSVSELSCDIAKDVYNDFTTWGEFHRSSYTINTDPEPYMRLNDNFLCERFNSSYGADSGYFCLVSYGLFNLSSASKVLSAEDRGNLTSFGCCDPARNINFCGCTYSNATHNGVEFKLDEICLNEVFNNLKYKGLDFCTSNALNYLRMGEPGTAAFPSESLKFGNRICYCNVNNNGKTSTEGWNWCTSCSSLCDASGDRYNWPDMSEAAKTPITRTDFDRTIWWSDNNSDKYYVNDSFLMEPSAGVGWMAVDYNSNTYDVRDDGNLYFYQVIWWDLSNAADWNTKWKRYSVIFTKVPTQKFESLDKNSFINKLTSFYDNETKARFTIAGRWWPELRTVYDGIVELTDDVSLTELKLKLETLNSYADVIPCSLKSDCLDYNINMVDWGENLYDYDMQSGTFLLPNKNRIFIRTNAGDEWINKGKYRVIARHWFSSYSQVQQFPCIDNQKWCKIDKILTVGRKIFNVSSVCPSWRDDEIDCNPLSGSWGTAGGSVWDHFVTKKYADKSIIIYELGCSDSDKTPSITDGINYKMYGEVVDLNNNLEGDYCNVDDKTLNEKYCDDLGQIASKTFVCPSSCQEGRCCSKNSGVCLIDSDCCKGLKCNAGSCVVTQCNDDYDNDNDGYKDLDDPSCKDIDDDTECGSIGVSCAASSECCTGLTCISNACG